MPFYQQTLIIFVNFNPPLGGQGGKKTMKETGGRGAKRRKAEGVRATNT